MGSCFCQAARCRRPDIPSGNYEPWQGLVKAAHPQVVEPDAAAQPRHNIARRIRVAARIGELEAQHLHRAVAGHREVGAQRLPCGRTQEAAAARQLPRRPGRRPAGNRGPTARPAKSAARRRARAPRSGNGRGTASGTAAPAALPTRLFTNSTRSARRPAAPSSGRRRDVDAVLRRDRPVEAHVRQRPLEPAVVDVADALPLLGRQAVEPDLVGVGPPVFALQAADQAARARRRCTTPAAVRTAKTRCNASGIGGLLAGVAEELRPPLRVRRARRRRRNRRGGRRPAPPRTPATASRGRRDAGPRRAAGSRAPAPLRRRAGGTRRPSSSMRRSAGASRSAAAMAARASSVLALALEFPRQHHQRHVVRGVLREPARARSAPACPPPGAAGAADPPPRRRPAARPCR